MNLVCKMIKLKDFELYLSVRISFHFAIAQIFARSDVTLTKQMGQNTNNRAQLKFQINISQRLVLFATEDSTTKAITLFCDLKTSETISLPVNPIF